MSSSKTYYVSFAVITAVKTYIEDYNGFLLLNPKTMNQIEGLKKLLTDLCIERNVDFPIGHKSYCVISSIIKLK